MGIAYDAENDPADARQALQKALTLAPDDASRARVQDAMNKFNRAPAGATAANGAAGAGSGATATSAALASVPSVSVPALREQSPAAVASSGVPQAGGQNTDFHGEIERMVRNIPFAGPKVQSVKWPDKLKATVLMDNFPMDKMPPFAKQMFESDLKNGIKNAKTDHRIKGTVVVEIADTASGAVMERVSQ